ncbi:tRNA glutamyl-Q(34) synthetase GluQRS [Spiribacter halobius]|uniref:Glutamyl-Q tRNA(Asp) synthetase n=1 Tax=Sediminicurvatus halobius TaxID=2182432 RepID=A0A2U2N2P2_9GAMM|nr:tRNA glutamyl-Q(34) synthetase GluQRS [Spiribacter halobius]PWG63505.1 tRNA glutamyl-Q(34) synthetase GluQRS [Spiribacter halobius]UEX79881.1 tRNA glutamyl-Q(34) synthetase GluQRS [Spiribacter halobius]
MKPETRNPKPARYVGRFAPSPTGPLHFGSLVAAVGSWLDARAAGGSWAVRIDDVDRGRAVTGADAVILRQLEACGLTWDGPVVYQSARDEAYAAALARLQAADRAYPCGCTRREIAAVARRGPAGMIYPGTCRAGLPPGREARSWRLLTRGLQPAFDDRRHGPQRVDLEAEVGDFVIRRADGLFAYHLAMVVDDAELGVTDVVRGGDLLAATAPQVALQAALGLHTPRYLHLPVALAPDGHKLSKSVGSAALDIERPGEAVTSALAFLGQPPPPALAGARPGELLAWAVGAWRPERLPARNAIAPYA